MSWSLSHTGKMGIVRDSYHRFALTITVNPSEISQIEDEELEDLATLVNHGCKHLLFRITDKYDNYQNSSAAVQQLIMQYINYLHERNHDSKILNENKLTWNLVIMIMSPIQWAHCDVFSSFITSNNLGNDTNMKFNVYIATDVSADDDDMSGDYHAIIATYGNMVECIRKKSKTLMLGVTDVFNRKTLQHLFEEHGENIQLCLPGNLDLPNMHARNVEFIHGCGCNTFYYINSDVMNNLDREDVPTLEPLLEKYDMCKNNLGSLFIKVVIQYGPVPCIDIAVGVDYIMDYLVHITHPFVYRTGQQAPTVNKRYVIDKDDIDDLIVESEEIECKQDADWMRAYLHTIKLRTLTVLSKRTVYAL